MHVENSEFQPPAAHYPVDDITEKTDCELHMSMNNVSFKVAVGYALPNPAGASYHLGGIPPSYARVGVDEVVPLYANLELDIPGGDGEDTGRSREGYRSLEQGKHRVSELDFSI